MCLTPRNWYALILLYDSVSVHKKVLSESDKKCADIMKLICDTLYIRKNW